MPEETAALFSFPIDPGSNINWFLLAEKNTGFTQSAGANIARVLCAVKRVFEDVFGMDVVNGKRCLLILHRDGVPDTLRQENVIRLSSTGAYYQQHIFQFSHELCHFMVPEDVCASFRWFEETLCQLMPVYVFQKLREQEKTVPIWELSTLYASMDGYILEACPPYAYPEATFQAFFKRALPNLQANCYMRDYNDAVAAWLKPIFFEQPSLWRIVPKLHLLKDGLSFDAALQVLCHAAGISDELMNRLVACFLEQ